VFVRLAELPLLILLNTQPSQDIGQIRNEAVDEDF